MVTSPFAIGQPLNFSKVDSFIDTRAIITIGKNDLVVHGNGSMAKQIAAKPALAPYDNSLSYLKAVIAGDIKPDGPSSLADNIIVTEILDAARRSAATGKTVSLTAIK